MIEGVYAGTTAREIDYRLLMFFESEGYIPKCSLCSVIISKSFTDEKLILNAGKPVAIAVQVSDDDAEFYCRTCYDKLLC